MKVTKKLTLVLLIMSMMFSGSWAYGETTPAGEPGEQNHKIRRSEKC